MAKEGWSVDVGYVHGELYYDFTTYHNGPVSPGTETWERLLYHTQMGKTAWFAGARKLHTCMVVSAQEAHDNIMMFGTPFKADAYRLLAAFKGTDPDVEREPPPPATPLQFPRPISVPTRLWSNSDAPPDFQRLFGTVMRPVHLSKEHVAALNIDIRTPIALEDIVPRTQDGVSYIPSADIGDLAPLQSYVAAARHDSVIIRRDKDLSDRLTELRFDNDAAFRVVSRTPPKEGMKPPRLAYLRKFWEGLENMSQYWDCSLDQYYKTKSPEPDPPDGFDDPFRKKKIRLDSLPAVPISRNPPNSPTPDTQPELDADVESSWPAGTKLEDGPHTVQEEFVPVTALRYKGRRTSTGKDMPPAFLTATVTAFAEAVAWQFQCTVMAPRRMPVIQLGRFNIPVKLTAGIYRVPPDRQRSRQGWVEGPLMGILCRPETEFGKTEGAGWDWNSGTDLLREISALIELAQERRREKQVNRKPGEGQWWTEKPRWGGGRGGEVGSEEGNADASKEEIITSVEETVGLKTYKKAPPARKTPAMLWKELKCGSSVWDSKILYEAIGKTPGSEWDEIFLLSSLNHHISIVKLSVHEAYLEYLHTGALPNPRSENEEWSKPRLDRSVWFDLFDAGQRVQAFLALWGLMAYLNRDTTATGTGASQGGN